MSAADVAALKAALADVCERFGAAAASATYVSPIEGRLVRMHCTAHGLVWLEDDDGHVAVPREPAE